MCLWLHLRYIYVILLNICDISMHFFIISPISFRAENRSVVSELLLIVFLVHVPDKVQV
jgi:hypothetical protein